METLLDNRELQEKIEGMAQEIAIDLNRPPKSAAALVGIRRRGVPLAERIAKVLQEKQGQSLPLGTLDITFYRDDLSHVAQQPVVGVTELPFDVTDRKIYLVDDVLYTGRTIRAAMDSLMEFGRPSAIRLVVLVDRGHRELPIQSDIVGVTLESEPHDNVEVKLTEIDGIDGIVFETGKGTPGV